MADLDPRIFAASLGLMIALSAGIPADAQSQTAEAGIGQEVFRSLIGSLNGRIDNMAGDAQLERQAVQEQLGLLEDRVDGYQVLDDRLTRLEERLTSMEALDDRLRRAIESSEAQQQTVQSIKEETSKALREAEAARTSARSTAWILTVVSSIVSVLVLLIGLFFSSRFMQLHAENQVSKALLERIERELAGKGGDSRAG